MAEGVRFTVTNPQAPVREADPGIRAITEDIRRDVQARTPVITGRLQAGWRVEKGDREGSWVLVNPVYYARYVEYGTVNMAAEPMVGPVLAAYRARMYA